MGHLANDLPGPCPAHAILIHEQAHELWNCNGRVCVVELERHLVCKVVEVVMRLLVSPNDILPASARLMNVFAMCASRGNM